MFPIVKTNYPKIKDETIQDYDHKGYHTLKRHRGSTNFPLKT